MTAATIAQALLRLRPAAEFNVTGDTVADIVWLDGSQTQPTDQEVTDEVAVVEQELAASQFQVNREAEYRARGLTVEAMVEALWQKVMESDSTEANSLQVIRDQVKNEYPEIQS